MDTKRLLKSLQIKDKSIIFDFFIVYSRFEYALKRSGYTRRLNHGVDADWECFISHISDDFDPTRTPELQEAVNYLTGEPTKAQVVNDSGRLTFAEHPSTQQGPVALKVYHSIRIARNNLFHGGKFPCVIHYDIGRDETLLKSSLIVIEEFLTLCSEVKPLLYRGHIITSKNPM